MPKTGRAITPASTRSREGAIQAIAIASRRAPVDPMALFAVSVTFYLWSNQMRDIDNLAKLVLDGLKGTVWADDSQVVKLAAAKQKAHDEASARTELTVERIPGQVPWTFCRCGTCSRPFRVYPSWKYRQYCSRRCWAIGTRARFTGVCIECQQEFEAKEHQRTTRKFCSLACKRLHGSEPAVCAVCGGGYRRQKNLARKGRAVTCSKVCGVRHGWATRSRLAQIRRHVPTGMGRRLRVAV